MTGGVGGDGLAAALAAFIAHDLLYDRAGVRVELGAELFGGGLLDSVALLRLVTHLEEEYGITVRDEELVPEHFGTVSHLAAFVRGKRSAGP